MPAISWATTFHPLQQYGLKLRFVDVELDTLNMDVVEARSGADAAHADGRRASASSAIRRRSTSMRAFCDAHGLIFFEDNCESMGASLNGRPCGTFGDVNTFSTFYSHHISTMEGGLLRDERHRDRSSGAGDPQSWLGARRAGRLAAQQPAAHDDPFFEAYRFVRARLQRAAARDVPAPSASSS